MDCNCDIRATAVSKTRYKARTVVEMDATTSSGGLRDASTRHLRNRITPLVIKSRCLNVQKIAQETPIPFYAFPARMCSWLSLPRLTAGELDR